MVETLGMCQEEVEVDSKVSDLAGMEYAVTKTLGDWTADDVHNFCYIVENDYCSGIMWAMKKDDGGMTLEISMVKQILEDRHKSIC